MGNCVGIRHQSVPTADAHVEIGRAGLDVTVKRMKSDNIPGISKWQLKTDDMKYLGKFWNPNMAYVLGKTDEQFVPNGNLRQHLDGDNGTVLSWATRMKIAVGIAEEIKYLNDQNAPINWKGLRSEDVLLGQDYHPKLSNLAKLEVPSGILIAPGAFYPGGDSSSSGIGMLLLELLTGKKPMDLTMPVEQSGLLDWIHHRVRSMDEYPFVEIEPQVLMVVDPRLQANYDMDSASKILQWGLDAALQRGSAFNHASNMTSRLCNHLENTPPESCVTMDHYITLTHSLSAMRIK